VEQTHQVDLLQLQHFLVVDPELSSQEHGLAELGFEQQPLKVFDSQH
jgi:hypothetical protein